MRQPFSNLLFVTQETDNRNDFQRIFCLASSSLAADCSNTKVSLYSTPKKSSPV